MNITSSLSSPAFQTATPSNNEPKAAPAAARVFEVGMTWDATDVMLSQYGKNNAAQLEFDYRVALNHRANPAQQANTALTTIDEQLKKIEKDIQSKRPDILKSDWDFTIQDG